eukprot:scaffold26595_cov80-Skeletonema_marinoi.AAC.2
MQKARSIPIPVPVGGHSNSLSANRLKYQREVESKSVRNDGDVKFICARLHSSWSQSAPARPTKETAKSKEDDDVVVKRKRLQSCHCDGSLVLSYNHLTILQTSGAIGENGERMWLSRHYLDMYGSRTHVNGNKEKKPVVIFLTGGAWIIGYRMWGCLLARALVPFGILVIIPDYRNFPKVNIKGMVDDVDMSIQWVLDHVEEYGGDGKRVVLVGQSA